MNSIISINNKKAQKTNEKSLFANPIIAEQSMSVVKDSLFNDFIRKYISGKK